jgi:hypothetical protein
MGIKLNKRNLHSKNLYPAKEVPNLAQCPALHSPHPLVLPFLLKEPRRFSPFDVFYVSDATMRPMPERWERMNAIFRSSFRSQPTRLSYVRRDKL